MDFLDSQWELDDHIMEKMSELDYMDYDKKITLFDWEKMTRFSDIRVSRLDDPNENSLEIINSNEMQLM